MSRSHTLLLLVVSVALLSSAGCAAVPQSGPVQRAGSVGAAVEQPVVRRLAPPPRPGAGPEEIVQGFLLASADFGNLPTALRFLTPAAQSRWKREVGVSVVQSSLEQVGTTPPSASTSSATPAEQTRSITLSGTQVALIDNRWSYQQFPVPTPVSIRMGLVKDTRTSGEWRIDTLPDGVYLPSYELQRTFRSAVVYFADPHRTHVVPVPVVVPAVPTLAQVLTARLVQGPGAGLGKGLASALPTGTRLTQPVVQQASGLVQVQLDPAPGAAATVEDPQLLAAQLLATLGQVSSINAVQVSLGSRVVVAAGEGMPVSPDGLRRFNAEVPLATPLPLLAVQEGRLGRVDDQNWTPLEGLAGTEQVSLALGALSLDATQVAGVNLERTRLFVGPVGGEQFSLRHTGSTLGDPSFDSAGTVWVLDQAAATSPASRSGSTLVGITADNRRLTVPLTGLPGPVQVARVSRDGLRVALVCQVNQQDQLIVAALQQSSAPTGQPRLEGATRIAPHLVDVADVAWQDSHTLAVIAAPTRAVRQPYVLGLDGFTLEERNPLPFTPDRISAAPGQPLMVASDQTNARLYRSTGTTWQRASRGSDPSYPG